MRTRIISLLIAMSAILSCRNVRLEKALKLAGCNRPALENVLDRYRREGDTQKRRAAEYLIVNMPFHFGYEGEALEESKVFFRLIRENPQQDFDSLALVIREKTGPGSDRIRVRDIEKINADLLSENIDWAFLAWRTQPWGKSYDFDTFCEYVLPYRIGTEALSPWRKRFYETFNPLLDDFRHCDTLDITDPAAALAFLIEKMNLPEPVFTSATPVPFPNIGPEWSSYMTGTCRDMTDYIMYVARAVGIPVARNFTVRCDRLNGGHDWGTVLGREKEYSIFFYPPSLVPLDRELMTSSFKTKAFRERFSPDLKAYRYAKKNRDDTYPGFAVPMYTDVTEKFTQAFVDVLPFPLDSLYERVSARVALYLCSSSRMDWIPEQLSYPGRRTVDFHSLQAGEVLRIGRYRMGVLEMLSDPFTVDAEMNRLHFFRPEPHTARAVLYSKFTVNGEELLFRNNMTGGVVEGSASPDFSHADTLYVISEAPHRKFSYGRIASRKPHRYVRYRGRPGSHSEIADLTLFDSDGAPLSGKIILPADSLAGERKNQAAYVFDGLTTTSYHCEMPSGGWVGMDFGSPKTVATLRYTPRNRDNFVTPGDTYELYYMDRRWKSLGTLVAESDSVVFEGVPGNAILLLADKTAGQQERIFTYEKGVQVMR